GIVDPGPAPGVDPDPVAEVVRRPSSGDGARGPNRAVVGVVAPGAVGVEVFVADHVAGDVTGGDLGVGLVAVAGLAPAIEIVGRGRSAELGGDVVEAGDAGGLAGVYGEGRAAARDDGIAAAHGDEGQAVIAIGIDAVVAGAQEGDGDVGGVDFEDFVFGEVA